MCVFVCLEVGLVPGIDWIAISFFLEMGSAVQSLPANLVALYLTSKSSLESDPTIYAENEGAKVSQCGEGKGLGFRGWR